MTFAIAPLISFLTVLGLNQDPGPGLKDHCSFDECPACVLTPKTGEGPFYIPNEAVRSNIAEDHPGVPLILKVTVKDVQSCRAVSKAQVDIWHADALGIYSGYLKIQKVGTRVDSHQTPTDKSSFCRGVQVTNAEGEATFRTIIPGWYPGRTVHFHVTVYVDHKRQFTGQLYFFDKDIDGISTRFPYKDNKKRHIHNDEDSLFSLIPPIERNRTILRLEPNKGGFKTHIVLGIHSH